MKFWHDVCVCVCVWGWECAYKFILNCILGKIPSNTLSSKQEILNSAFKFFFCIFFKRLIGKGSEISENIHTAELQHECQLLSFWTIRLSHWHNYNVKALALIPLTLLMQQTRGWVRGSGEMAHNWYSKTNILMALLMHKWGSQDEIIKMR